MFYREVIPFKELKKSHRDNIGAKAMGLSEMSRLGLDVPPGFCILGHVYTNHLKNSGLIPWIKNFLNKLENLSQEQKVSLLTELRQKIIESPIPETLRSRIKEHYEKLGAKKVAVRSTATAEDLPGQSFAGLYDTYLGISDLEGCLLGIKRCWASLWTERAFDYRERNKVNHLDVKMAVIVQKLVISEVSGVIFTADPLSPGKDALIIEACYGLGEGLVSGKVTPDRFVLKRSDLSTITHTVSEKRIEVVPEDGKTSREQEVPQERRSLPCIDEETAKRLGKLALKAESVFGSPQDVEWAIMGGEIFLLQSRPITTLKQSKTLEERQVWSNMNVGEVLPDIVTPCTWSLVDFILKKMFDAIFGIVGMSLADAPLITQIAGRVYFNMNTLIGMFHTLPFNKFTDINKILGGHQGKMESLGKLDIPKEDIPTLKFSLLNMIIKMPWTIVWFSLHSPKKGKLFISVAKRQIDELRSLDLNSMPEQDLIDLIYTIIRMLSINKDTLAYPMVGMFYFAVMSDLCLMWLEDKDGAIVKRLVSGMGGMDSAEAGLDLWRMASFANQYPSIREEILSGKDYKSLREKVVNTEGGREFFNRWDKFVRDHGHHAQGEIELFNARWSERPDYILQMVRIYIQSIGKIDPVANHTQHRKERKTLTQDCRKRLKNPIKRMIFEYLLDKAQLGPVVREGLKSGAVQVLASIRTILLNLGEKWRKRGVLDVTDDIFFLSLYELDSIQNRKQKFNVKETIAQRRAEYQKNLSITPPAVVVGRFDPENFIPDSLYHETNTLTGLAVSAGVVTGPARVILRTGTDEHVLPGEILVAPFTDPGWTPYFMTAGGIVMDMGGLLSHGSIVAREYGIPAVVNVGDATKIIKTGQMLHVDGNKGIVKILTNP